ncbi:hypothetical protein RHRU231_770050 [Rhodococcus ruber]|uniref:Uncharacterized protein n=1 Tax=Rhodococcus ruber TaxID=1830 RepID=A0A098BQD6_9NOCA|nr:hypothetical protein RHRU231_770050 [Rhodococcus ruber]
MPSCRSESGTSVLPFVGAAWRAVSERVRRGVECRAARCEAPHFLDSCLDYSSARGVAQCRRTGPRGGRDAPAGTRDGRQFFLRRRRGTDSGSRGGRASGGQGARDHVLVDAVEVELVAEEAAAHDHGEPVHRGEQAHRGLERVLLRHPARGEHRAEGRIRVEGRREQGAAVARRHRQRLVAVRMLGGPRPVRIDESAQAFGPAAAHCHLAEPGAELGHRPHLDLTADVVESADVVVERGGDDAETAGEGAHRQLLPAGLVHHRRGRVDHLLAAEIPTAYRPVLSGPHAAILRIFHFKRMCVACKRRSFVDMCEVVP